MSNPFLHKMPVLVNFSDFFFLTIWNRAIKHQARSFRNFACFFYCLLIFFKINLKKNPSGIPSECHTAVWILVRSNSLSGLIWVQTVRKGYQQMTPIGKELTLLQGEIGEKKREQIPTLFFHWIKRHHLVNKWAGYEISNNVVCASSKGSD